MSGVVADCDNARESQAAESSASGVETGAREGGGTQQLRALLSRGRPLPSVVAKLVSRHRGEQSAMFMLLHTTAGNSYVQEVIAAISVVESTPPSRATTSKPADSIVTPEVGGQQASDTRKQEQTTAGTANDDHGLDVWDVVSIGTGGGGVAGRELTKRSSQFVKDLVASINQSPHHFVNELLALYKMHPDELLSFIQVAEGLLAAEVISGALLVAPDPTNATKVVAILLQLILVAFAVHVAVSEGPETIAAGQEWLRLCHAANGNPAAVDAAAAAFASCVFHLIQAIQAVVGGIAAVGDGIGVAGRDAPVVGDEGEIVAKDLAERQRQAREQKATREQQRETHPNTGDEQLEKDRRTSHSRGHDKPPENLGDSASWLEQLKSTLTPEELAHLERMRANPKGSLRTPEEIRQHYQGDLTAAKQQIQKSLGDAQAKGIAAEASLRRAAQMRAVLEQRGLLRDPEVVKIVDRLERELGRPELSAKQIEQAFDQAIEPLRNRAVGDILGEEIAREYPGATITRDVRVMEEQPEKSIPEYKANHPDASGHGLRERSTPEGPRVFKDVTDIDILVTEPSTSGGKAQIVRHEEVKTGRNDSAPKARAQLDLAAQAIAKAASGGKKIRLEVNGSDIAPALDLSSIDRSAGVTRGPSGGKAFDRSLGVSASDLEDMLRGMLEEELKMRKVSHE